MRKTTNKEIPRKFEKEKEIINTLKNINLQFFDYDDDDNKRGKIYTLTNYYTKEDTGQKKV